MQHCVDTAYLLARTCDALLRALLKREDGAPRGSEQELTAWRTRRNAAAAQFRFFGAANPKREASRESGMPSCVRDVIPCLASVQG